MKRYGVRVKKDFYDNSGYEYFEYDDLTEAKRKFRSMDYKYTSNYCGSIDFIEDGQILSIEETIELFRDTTIVKIQFNKLSAVCDWGCGTSCDRSTCPLLEKE